jgi:hypothetical protein
MVGDKDITVKHSIKNTEHYVSEDHVILSYQVIYGPEFFHL